MLIANLTLVVQAKIVSSESNILTFAHIFIAISIPRACLDPIPKSTRKKVDDFITIHRVLWYPLLHLFLLHDDKNLLSFVENFMDRYVISAWFIVGVVNAFLLMIDFYFGTVVDSKPDVLDILAVALVVYPVLLSWAIIKLVAGSTNSTKAP